MKSALLIAFGMILQSFWRALFGWFGEYMVKEIRYWPMVAHYLDNHDGRHTHCHECLLGRPKQVDSIN